LIANRRYVLAADTAEFNRRLASDEFAGSNKRSNPTTDLLVKKFQMRNWSDGFPAASDCDPPAPVALRLSIVNVEKKWGRGIRWTKVPKCLDFLRNGVFVRGYHPETIACLTNAWPKEGVSLT
jgi:hypothetical protein